MSKKRPYARKRFGQHFLKDTSVLKTIVYAAGVKDSEYILEIGPGRGDLTFPLLETGAHLKVIEIDRDLVGELKLRFSQRDRFELIEGDALKMDWEELFQAIPEPMKMVANLPYNISTPLFFKILKHRNLFHSITVMVQKEVADRLHYEEGNQSSKDYGILTVSSANFFDSKMICKVPPGAFVPPPKVDSAVIQLTPKPTDIEDEEGFLDFIRHLFQQRRKRLIPRIRELYPEIYAGIQDEDLKQMENYRPEHLTPRNYVSIFKGLPL